MLLGGVNFFLPENPNEVEFANGLLKKRRIDWQRK